MSTKRTQTAGESAKGEQHKPGSAIENSCTDPVAHQTDGVAWPGIVAAVSAVINSLCNAHSHTKLIYIVYILAYVAGYETMTKTSPPV